MLFLTSKKFCCEVFFCQSRQERHFYHGSWLFSPLIKHPVAKSHHPCGDRSEKFKLRAKPETQLLLLSKNLLLIFIDLHELAATLKEETQFEILFSCPSTQSLLPRGKWWKWLFSSCSTRGNSDTGRKPQSLPLGVGFASSWTGPFRAKEKQSKRVESVTL